MTVFLFMRLQLAFCLPLFAILAFHLALTSEVLSQSIDPPPGQGAPSGTVGGGSRTSVLTGDRLKTLIKLIHTSNQI